MPAWGLLFTTCSTAPHPTKRQTVIIFKKNQPQAIVMLAPERAEHALLSCISAATPH
jgi:hypothetical protein